jgi:hypothetical protein
VLLSQVGHRDDAIYQRFLDLFAERLGGTPLYVTVLAAAAFYAYAALRRVPRSADALTATVALLAAVGPDTLTLEAAGPVRPLPLVAAALLQLGLGFRQRHAGRYLLGTATATALVALFVGAPEALELGLVALLIGGARLATAPVEVFPLVLAALLAGYGLMLGNRISQGSAAVLVLGWLASLSWLGYGWLRQLVAGLDYLALSLLVFVLAVLTSVVKSGVLARLAPTRDRA